MGKITITIPDHQAAALHEAVEAGSYATADDVMHEALDLWTRRQDWLREESAWLKRAYDEGKASGPGRRVDFDDLLQEFKEQAALRG